MELYMRALPQLTRCIIVSRPWRALRRTAWPSHVCVKCVSPLGLRPHRVLSGRTPVRDTAMDTAGYL